MLSCLYLGAKCLLGIYERHRNSQTKNQCAPIPLPEKPTISTRDVSILIPTINTPDAFTECMRLWLANEPKEIIIVTIPRDLQRVKELLAPVGDTSTPISVFTVPKPGRRAQMSLALDKATGSIITYVDDDTYWPTNKVLPHLLAGFHDPAVGGVMGRQSASVPVHRQKPSIVTATEVATMRTLSSSSDSNAAMYASEGTVWCLTGRTMLARAAALKDGGHFAHALTHETFRGRPINTGDDGFVTHYLLNRGWRLVFQSAQEAEVLTLVESGANFVRQLVRWRRSGYRTHVALMLHEPGFWRLRREHPGYALKILRFMVKPVTSIFHAAAWVQTIRHWPCVAIFFAAYYLYRFTAAAWAFRAKNPWIGYRHLWAVVAVDNVYRLITPYVVLTLGVEGWLTRDDSGGEK